MIKRIEGWRVDVVDKNCGPRLACYWLFADKGTFAVGRGYTRYHDRERLVCGTRHLHGCPAAYRCEACGAVVGPYAADGRAHYCGGSLVEYRGADNDR